MVYARFAPVDAIKAELFLLTEDPEPKGSMILLISTIGGWDVDAGEKDMQDR